MPYYCTECGEEESFKANRELTQYGTEDVYIDSDGGVNDYGDFEVNDTESDDMSDITCGECGSEVIWIEDDKIEEIKAETKKKLENKTTIVNWKSKIKADEQNDETENVSM